MRGKKMNTIRIKKMTKFLFSSLLLILITTGCERSVDGLEEADLSSNPSVFVDGFSGGLEYAVFQGAVLNAFQVDTEVTSDGTGSSMRFAVPDVGDPRGSYAGGTFFTTSPRDLSEYNALTFYAKATESVPLGVVGFGNDLGENKFTAEVTDFRANTNWKKYIIPIPDPSKLTSEKGMFFYSFGPIDGKGYTVWVDEVKFENLGTIGQPRFEILNGEDETTSTFTGVTTEITGLTSIYNLSDGTDQSVNSAPAYFEFSSSNTSIAEVDEEGNVLIGAQGSAVVTASVGDIDADGSLTVDSRGEFTSAPTPTRDAANVISIFSDAYNNVEVDYYNGFFNGDGQTTQGGTGPGGADLIVNGNGVINYTQLNFVGIGTFMNVPSIDATEMTHLHVDINVNEAIQSGDFIRLQLLNSVGDGETSGSFTINANILLQNTWIGLDIPLSSFNGLNDRSEIGLTFFVSDNTVSDIFVDNIYFFKN
jgi:hypothetical protein